MEYLGDELEVKMRTPENSANIVSVKRGERTPQTYLHRHELSRGGDFPAKGMQQQTKPLACGAVGTTAEKEEGAILHIARRHCRTAIVLLLTLSA